MIEFKVEVQYVRSDDLDQWGHGPYLCVHRNVAVREDSLPDIHEAISDIERHHLQAMGATQPLLHMNSHLEPVDRLPA